MAVITRSRALAIITFCLLSDQLSKLLVRQSMAEGDSIRLLGDLFRLTYVENRAGVMGISLIPMWLLTLLSVSAAVWMAWWLFSSLPAKGWLQAILPWILGGALGNMVDRIWFRSVTDMLDVDIPDIRIAPMNLAGWAFPGFELERWWVFNLADSYIFVCMILLILLSLAGKLDPQTEQGSDR